MAQAQTEDTPEIEWREVEGKEFKVPFDPETGRPYSDEALSWDDSVRGDFARGFAVDCAYADCDGKDHDVVVNFDYTKLDACDECGAANMGYRTEHKVKKEREKKKKEREREQQRREIKLNRINADLPDVDVPDMHDSFDRGPFWMIDSEKAKVPSDDLGQWRGRLEEIEEAALMLAKAAQKMQSTRSPEEAYRKFKQLNKAWNKTTYQTRRITEGVSINEEAYIVAESE